MLYVAVVFCCYATMLSYCESWECRQELIRLKQNYDYEDEQPDLDDTPPHLTPYGPYNEWAPRIPENVNTPTPYDADLRRCHMDNSDAGQ